MNPALKERLALDYQQMVNLRDQSSIIEFTPAKGTVPYISEYLVTVNLETYISPSEKRQKHELRITLPPGYPNEAPIAVMLTTPTPFHPNWWSKTNRSDFCTNSGSWSPSETLGELVVRMLKVMLYYPDVTNPDSRANGSAAEWYSANKHLFPLGVINLDPNKTKAFEMLNTPPPTNKEFRFL